MIFCIFTSHCLNMFIIKCLLTLQLFSVVLSDNYQIAEGVYSFTSSSGYVSMFILTGEGVVVIEPISSQHAMLMVEEITSITTEPIKYVFYSHNHWDHASGGQVFQDLGATIIAHE